MKRIYKHDFLNEGKTSKVVSAEDLIFKNPELYAVSGNKKTNSLETAIFDVLESNNFTNIWEFKGNRCAETIEAVCESNNIPYVTVNGRNFMQFRTLSDIVDYFPCHFTGDDVTDTVHTLLIVKNFTSMKDDVFETVARLLLTRRADDIELDDYITPIAVSTMDESSYAKYDALPAEISQNIKTLSWSPRSDDDVEMYDSYRPRKSRDINESAIVNVATKATIDALRKINESVDSSLLSNLSNLMFSTIIDFNPFYHYFRNIDKKDNLHNYTETVFKTYIATLLNDIYDYIDDMEFDNRVNGDIDRNHINEYLSVKETIEIVIKNIRRLKKYIAPNNYGFMNQYERLESNVNSIYDMYKDVLKGISNESCNFKRNKKTYKINESAETVTPEFANFVEKLKSDEDFASHIESVDFLEAGDGYSFKFKGYCKNDITMTIWEEYDEWNDFHKYNYEIIDETENYVIAEHEFNLGYNSRHIDYFINMIETKILSWCN